MASRLPSPQAAAALAVALLADFSSAPSLTDTLVQLASASSVAPNSTLAFYSALHTLVSSLLLPAPSHPPLPTLAQFFVESLVPALVAAGSPSETLADVLVDVVWQVDQQIDAGVVYHQPVDVAVAVDAGEIKAGRLRIAELLKLLIDAGVVSQDACVERLDAGFITLAPLGLVSDPIHFGRLEIRCRTALFYKQQKFNLLREESEGYAKLAAELLSNMGPPHSVLDAKSQEGEKGRMRRARLVGDSVKSLIGNFDLDPDRTLDIILDTFSDQLIQHHQFFLDLLSVSPWAPKKPATPAATSEATNGKGKKPLVDVGYENDTGSFLIAQILGFKFGYYQGADVGATPEKLYLMTALLVWNGFLKLSDIWSHLSPDDEEVMKMEGRYRDAQAQLARSVGGSNALANAGMLADDAPIRPSGSSPSKAAPAAEVKRELPNQKLGLLRALLSIGDLTHSLFVLAQFPFLVSVYPDLADLLSRLLDESINPVYRGLAYAQKTAEYETELQAPKPRYTSATKSSSLVPKSAALSTSLTGRAFPDPTKEYTFFFADWRSRLPRAGDMDEALEVAELYLPFIGVFISRSFPVYSKMCRLISKDLKSSSDGPRVSRWVDLVRTHLLPAVALLESHSVAAIEIWTVLVHLPIEKRYELYGEWKDTTYRRIPALSVRKAEAERDVKSILRRLSTENVKKLGKTLAKTAHTNPTIIFAIVLNQVQSYDNLIVPVVDAARYLSEFGYDVMTFSLLDALSSGKAKTKEDGTSVAMWLSGLASFAGQLYKRWPAMSGSLWLVLQYLVNQLVSGNVKDLIILREIITRMSALEPFADLSDAQVMSLAGGKVLRSEVFNQTDTSQASKRQALASLQSAKNRLTNTLQRSGLAMPLLINIAIQRQACVADAEAHLKSLGGLFDGCHAVLFQYIEFLHAALDPETLAAQVPTIADLMEKYGLEAAVAFDIGRPKIRMAMRLHDETDAKSLDTKRKSGLLLKLAQEKAVAAAETLKSEDKTDDAVKGEEALSSPSAAASANEDTIMGDATEPSSPVVAQPVVPWHPGLRDVIKTAQRILPANVLSIMGSAFFATFWQLTLYDIVYPGERYEAEILRCTTMQREVNAVGNALKPDEKEKFTRGVIDLAGKLSDEAGKHSVAKGVTNRRLGREKAHWFSSITTVSLRTELVLQIIQYCVHPRAKLSLADAAFSYEFIKRMHSMNTASFHTVVYYDKLLSEQLGPILYTCTENEARNYARFLNDTLKDLHRWYFSGEEYKKEAIGPQLQGFLRAGGTPGDHILHDRIKIFITNWHIRMAKTFKAGFQSGEYMQIKNTILVLTKIAPYFPIQYETGSGLEASVATLCEVEKRDDLKILASGYKAVLSKRRRHWVDPPADQVKPKPAPASAAVSQTMSRPATLPTPASASPQSTTSANAVPTGPKFGLPVRPGNSGSAPGTPARTEAPVAMDVDKPLPRVSADPPRRPAEQRSSSASTVPTSNASGRFPSSLPQRPPSGREPRDGRDDSSRREETSDSSSLAPSDKLRQQALASSKRAAPMDPPPAPSGSSSVNTSILPPRREPSSSTTLPARRDTSSSSAAPSNARIPSAPSSRQTSPRASDNRTSDNTSSSRDKSSRDSDRPERSSRRERSVESEDSSRRRSGDKDSKHDSSKERSSRGEDRHRSSRGDERSSRDTRDEPRRSDRDQKDDRGDDRHKSSSSKDVNSSSSSSRNVRDDDKGRASDSRASDSRTSDSRTSDSRRRDGDHNGDHRRASSGQGSAERDKERDREKEKERPSSRSDARDKDSSRSSRHERSPERSSTHTSRANVSTSRSEQDLPPSAPTGPRALRAVADRLALAPAQAAAPPTAPAESGSAFSIKGRGGGGSKLFSSAMGGSSSSISRDSRRVSTSGRSSHREEPSSKKESTSTREEEGRKRPSTSSSLADRLGNSKSDAREEGPSDPKRPRILDTTRDAPPHATRTQSSSSTGRGGGDRGAPRR